MQQETVVAAVRQLRLQGERISLRAIKTLVGGSYRDLGPLLKTILSAEEWSDLEPDTSEPPLPPPGQLAIAREAVDAAEVAVGEVQNLLDAAHERLRRLQATRPPSTTNPHDVQAVVEAQLAHEAETLTAQREVEALQRILDGRRAEQAALKADYQRLQERARDLRHQQLPALQRQLVEARDQMVTRERDAAHAIALARRRVEHTEEALADATMALQRLTGAH